MTTATYTVTGMTCGHCVAAVTDAVAALPGVSGVDGDLPAGTVTVTSETPSNATGWPAPSPDSWTSAVP